MVPRLESFSVPFDPASDEGAGPVDEHRALAASIGVHVTVLFCVCQRYDDVVHRMLGRSSLLVVGGRRRVWWPRHARRGWSVASSRRAIRWCLRKLVPDTPPAHAAGDGRLRTFLGTLWPLFRRDCHCSARSSVRCQLETVVHDSTRGIDSMSRIRVGPRVGQSARGFHVRSARSPRQRPLKHRQAQVDPNPGEMTLTGSFDGVSTYMFRGIRQNATGIALWPVLDLGVAVYSGDGSSRASASTSERGTACTPETPARTARPASCGTNRISTRSSVSGSAAASASRRPTRRTPVRTTRSPRSRRSRSRSAWMTALISARRAQAVRAGCLRVRHRAGHRTGGWRRKGGQVSRAGRRARLRRLRASLTVPVKVGLSLATTTS